jgi:hypothetical protein
MEVDSELGDLRNSWWFGSYLLIPFSKDALAQSDILLTVRDMERVDQAPTGRN